MSQIKIPGPDHPILIERNPKRVIVRFGEILLADTRRALVLREANYPAVNYVPRDDVDLSALKANSHRTSCPFKGDAAYFDIEGGGRRAAKAVWSYESPLAVVAEIANYLAFYPDHVTLEEH